jgi:type VI secretion system protein ImpC
MLERMKRDYVSTHLDVSPGEKKQMAPVEEGTPFRILLAGNFSAGTNRSRKALRVDFDNFEEILARLHPQLTLPGPDDPIRLRFESLDDFLPDALYQGLPLFQELSQRRSQILQAPTTPKPRRPSSAPDPVESALGSGSLLEDILSGTETPSPARGRADSWQQTIQDIVSPHVQPPPGRRETELAAQISDAAQLAMRLVLHHPDFQDLEAAWRSVDFLLRRLEIGADVQLYLLDLSKQELLGNVDALSRLATNDPWGVIAGLYTFEADAEELRALEQVARSVADVGAPFISSVSPRLMGCDSFGTHPDPEDWTAPLSAEAEEQWNILRALPEAQWIGLALPRFLLRDPYTKDSVESFEFDEMTAPPDHADFLWANPAVACACLLGESFLLDGWDIRLRSTQISSLPLYNYKSDGDTEMKPCAECWMAERTAEKFLNRGIMPLASMKHSDAVRLIRLQSIARPAAPLAGRWSS